MVERNDEALLRGAAFEEGGMPELEDQPPVAGRVAGEEPDLSSARLLGDDGHALAGRLVQPDSGMVDVDDTAEEFGHDAGDGAGLSAEEAAIRVETDPDGLGGGWPGYLDED